MSTFSQIYIQVVFAVKNRDALIASAWEERLYQYITGIVQNKGQKMLAINGMPDQIGTQQTQHCIYKDGNESKDQVLSFFTNQA